MEQPASRQMFHVTINPGDYCTAHMIVNCRHMSPKKVDHTKEGGGDVRTSGEISGSLEPHVKASPNLSDT